MRGDEIKRKDGRRLPHLFRDAPEENAERLEFEFEGLARTLADLALNRENDTPFTVVVRGDWGRGKTTLLKRARAILDEEGIGGQNQRPVKTLWFNAWKYPQEDSVLAGLLGGLLDEMRRGTPVDQLKVLVDRHKSWLAQTVLRVPLKGLLGDAKSRDRYAAVEEKRAFYDHFAELFGQATYLWFHGIASFRDNFGKNLGDGRGEAAGGAATGGGEGRAGGDAGRSGGDESRAGRAGGRQSGRDASRMARAGGAAAAPAGKGGANPAVAVFLDDLDRCRQDRVLEVLEAINLFLDQPGVCFYLGLN